MAVVGIKILEVAGKALIAGAATLLTHWGICEIDRRYKK